MVKKALLKAAKDFIYRGVKYPRSKGVKIKTKDPSRKLGYKYKWVPKETQTRGGEGAFARSAKDKQLIVNEMNKLDLDDLRSMTHSHLGQFMKSRLPNVNRSTTNVHRIRNEVIGGKVGTRENWLTREQNLNLEKFLREGNRYERLYDTQVKERFPNIGVNTIANFRKARGLEKTKVSIGPTQHAKNSIFSMLKKKYKNVDEDALYAIADDTRGFFIAEGKPKGYSGIEGKGRQYSDDQIQNVFNLVTEPRILRETLADERFIKNVADRKFARKMGLEPGHHRTTVGDWGE